MLQSNKKKTIVHGLLKDWCTKSKNHANKGGLIAVLQSNRPFDPFNEESKQMIQTKGKVECFELCEISPNMQCPDCLKYWTEGIVYCPCGTCSVPLRIHTKIESGNIRRNDDP